MILAALLLLLGAAAFAVSAVVDHNVPAWLLVALFAWAGLDLLWFRLRLVWSRRAARQRLKAKGLW